MRPRTYRPVALSAHKRHPNRERQKARAEAKRQKPSEWQPPRAA